MGRAPVACRRPVEQMGAKRGGVTLAVRLEIKGRQQFQRIGIIFAHTHVVDVQFFTIQHSDPISDR